MDLPAARPLRFQYPGAVYYLITRGDGGKSIFTGKEDHESFLHGLERVCISHGWRAHAQLLLGNHFHLLLETPEANLSCGMRVLLGPYSQAWDRRQWRRDHGESEAERNIGLVGAALEPLRSMEELGALRKGDPRKAICAALVKAHTSMDNHWLAQRLVHWLPCRDESIGQPSSEGRKEP